MEKIEFSVGHYLSSILSLSPSITLFAYTADQQMEFILMRKRPINLPIILILSAMLFVLTAANAEGRVLRGQRHTVSPVATRSRLQATLSRGTNPLLRTLGRLMLTTIVIGSGSMLAACSDRVENNGNGQLSQGADGRFYVSGFSLGAPNGANTTDLTSRYTEDGHFRFSGKP